MTMGIACLKSFHRDRISRGSAAADGALAVAVLRARDALRVWGSGKRFMVAKRSGGLAGRRRLARRSGAGASLSDIETIAGCHGTQICEASEHGAAEYSREHLKTLHHKNAPSNRVRHSRNGSRTLRQPRCSKLSTGRYGRSRQEEEFTSHSAATGDPIPAGHTGAGDGRPAPWRGEHGPPASHTQRRLRKPREAWPRRRGLARRRPHSLSHGTVRLSHGTVAPGLFSLGPGRWPAARRWPLRSSFTPRRCSAARRAGHDAVARTDTLEPRSEAPHFKDPNQTWDLDG